MKGMLIVISAPAGCGKDTIIDELFKNPQNINDGLFYSVSATTRQMRDGEVNGKHYFFKTRQEFEQLIQHNAFLEYTEYCGNYYGTLKETVDAALDAGKSVVLKIEVEGAENVRKMFKNYNPGAGILSIFILPPSLDELRCRLKIRRTEDDATIDKRVKRAVEEIVYADNYDYRVINDDLHTAIAQVSEIIRNERRKNDIHSGKFDG